jgi:hypothetical protein
MQRPQPLSSSALEALNHSTGSSVTSFSSNCTAPDHHSHHTFGLFTGLSMAADHSLPRPTSPRRSLPGSIDELLRSSFVAASQCVFSFSRTASERASHTNLEPTPFLTTVAKPVTLYDVEDVGSLNQLHQDPLFVDMPHGHQRNFIFPPSGDESSARVRTLNHATLHATHKH